MVSFFISPEDIPMGQNWLNKKLFSRKVPNPQLDLWNVGTMIVQVTILCRWHYSESLNYVSIWSVLWTVPKVEEDSHLVNLSVINFVDTCVHTLYVYVWMYTTELACLNGYQIYEMYPFKYNFTFRPLYVCWDLNGP